MGRRSCYGSKMNERERLSASEFWFGSTMTRESHSSISILIGGLFLCVAVKLSTCPTLIEFLGYASYFWPITFQCFTPTLSSLLSCRNSGIPNLPHKTTKNHGFHLWVGGFFWFFYFLSEYLSFSHFILLANL